MVLVPKKKKLLKKSKLPLQVFVHVFNLFLELSNNSAAKQKPTAGAPASKKVVPTPQKKKAAPLPKSEKPLGKPIEKPTAFSGISLLRGIKAKALVEEKDIQFDSEDEDSSSGYVTDYLDCLSPFSCFFLPTSHLSRPLISFQKSLLLVLS